MKERILKVLLKALKTERDRKREGERNTEFVSIQMTAKEKTIRVHTYNILKEYMCVCVYVVEGSEVGVLVHVLV